jgi:2-polyprenyl-3-methyl-5-hydroxy-6-metoxy-1,4-benzoquinol methylase
MYKNSNCLICSEGSFSPFLTAEDYTVSHESFEIVSCNQCGFKFTNPRPGDEKLGDYYKSEEYISHSDTKKGLIAKLYHAVRKRTLKQRLELVSGLVSRGSILDYGCGTGAFVETCRSAGWNAFGVEPDKRARQHAFESGLNVSENKSALEEKTQDLRFNAITLWHVLEHVTDMHQTLAFFKRRLTREGVLIIAVPNHLSYDAVHYGKFWAAYDVPRHLYHFEPTTITALLKSAGFNLEKMVPMKFDSFYVSLLSEKYQHGKARLLPALVNGLKSNLKAKGPQGYSSVIYIFRPIN